MLILAIDTSTRIGTAAIYSDEQGIIGEIILNCGNNHSETVMNAIDSLFKITKIDKKMINKIAVSIGPGSFTGIRIGVGIAKGLAYSLGIPIIGINELDVIANLAGVFSEEIKVIPMIDARKERVYYSVYSKNTQRISEYLDGELEKIIDEYKNERIIFLGDGAINYKKLIIEKMHCEPIFYSKTLSIPRASILAELALEREDDNIITLEPFYISKSQAERGKV